MPAVTVLAAPMVPAAFKAADVSYGAIAPMLIVVAGALVGVLVEAFAPRRVRHTTQLALALVTLVAAFVVLVTVSTKATNRGGTLAQAVIIDGPSLFLQGAILLMSVLGVLTMAEKFGGQGSDAFTPMGAAVPGSAHEAAALRAGLATSEVFPLTLFAVVGMMLFPAAGDLLTMFVALEVLSLPLYLMCGLARRRRLLSQEASLKYFLLGAFSSAFFLFGAALMYGYAGSLNIADIATAVSGASANLEGLLLPGVVFVMVGLLFKVGAVPFHSWTPDVYQGAPTPVTGFMAACTKVAAFGAILRIVYVGIEANRWDWRGGIIAVAALTMVVGAVLSVTQTDVKRLLAYSSIAHAGFILVAVLSFDRTGVSGTLFYLVAYGFMTIAGFAIVSMVRQGGSEASHLSQWAGLGRNHPVVAGVFAFLLLAFAGIPLTSGFTAKFAAFSPAVAFGGTSGVALVVIGVLCSVITAFVYVRLIVLMYFTEAPAGEAVVAETASPYTTIAITVGTLVTLVLGVLPTQVLDLAERSSQFLLK
ncbi:NADH-quinone oxidoreductase subunit NuoN [Phycicoccus sp. Soil748]|uniref:NADH-quinone oxidoreductase subunit NuoN n=1 Tax=Phycicoccus sp. Soil748 TaxID=1736397 RepID=UPI0007032F30|nr:NADH-quinone oxidoreductase subunit NuoN [Phycicoccus sp. Soil748]KRE58665.1 NADH:ubiquinone oxidoreductase subunit N [Phycicoccus sp. Soil748]